MRVEPTRDVAGGVDTGCARLKVLIDDDPTVGFEPCLLGELEAGPNADTNDHEIVANSNAKMNAYQAAASEIRSGHPFRLRGALDCH
jgi:hypothetical protein